MFRVTFLGTGGAIPQTKRNPSAIMAEREGDLILLDCGEGTQRQMMKHGTGFTVRDICITHIHGDHVLGIPGITQTWSYQDREEPLNIYTPKGTKDTIQELVHAAGHQPEYQVNIHELNPNERVQKKDHQIKTFETKHGDIESIGYTIIEDKRKGKFNKQKALELGIPEGPMFSQLHNGESVELEDGTEITPDMVVGEPRPGRKIVYTGDTRPTPEIEKEAQDAQLLIHDGMFHSNLEQRAKKTNHSTAEEAAKSAKKADTDLLVLTHISSRYSESSDPLKKEAQKIYPDTDLATDGTKAIVEYPDKDRETRITDQ